MEGTNQPPNWPPAPTVEDESPSGDQTTTATMPHVQNGASAPADGTDTHNAEPSTPVNNNNNTTANPTNNDAPTTPANAAPAALPADRVQVVLKDQNGTQIAFGVKTNTRMEKVQNAFAERTSRPVDSLRFFFDGDRVLPEDTVTTLGMENDDVIEVMTAQIGGGGGKFNTTISQPNGYTAKHGDDKMSFVVNAVEVGGKLISEIGFIIGPHVKVKAFMDIWAERAGCALDEVVFRRNPDKEGPGLPFHSEDETFGDISFMSDDKIFVSASVDEPTKPVDLTEDVSTKEVNTRSGTPNDTIVITVHDALHEMHCKMTETMSFDKFIDTYSKRCGVDVSTQRLTFNGKTVFPSDTPASIGAKHGDVLDIEDDLSVITMDLTID